MITPHAQPTNLAFLLDSSSSMSSAEWETQLEFVATVISELPEVGENGHRIAVAIFSDKDDFATVFDYNDFGFRSVLLVSLHFVRFQRISRQLENRGHLMIIS
jgi:hypothetical protein